MLADDNNDKKKVSNDKVKKINGKVEQVIMMNVLKKINDQKLCPYMFREITEKIINNRQ